MPKLLDAPLLIGGVCGILCVELADMFAVLSTITVC